MVTPRAAVQMIIFGERNRTDIEGVLKDVTTAGFDTIEAGNLFAVHGESRTRTLLAQNGVQVCGAHFGYADYADPDRFMRNLAFCKSLGIKNMICSGVSDPKSVDGYVASARLFNEVGARLRDEGLKFHYHNHNWEFEDLGATTGMAILASETDPDLVAFNIDVFWVTVGGADPVEFIAKHAGRAGYFHFKDGRRNADGQVEFLELGSGMIDLVGAYDAALKAGAEWIVAEQDRTALPHLESVTRSRLYMKETLGL